jgi:hypothetical protein
MVNELEYLVTLEQDYTKDAIVENKKYKIII